MPRPKTAQFWVDRIKELDANEPRMTHADMRRQLEEVGRKEQRDDCPSDRTMRTIRAKWKDPSFDEERRQYRYLYWPETFERGDLPWEAAAAALELRQVFAMERLSLSTAPVLGKELRLAGREAASRPSVRLTRWFWRLTQGGPDAEPSERYLVALWLAAAEAVGSGKTEVLRAAEDWLRYAPWRSTKAQTAYRKALAAGQAHSFRLEGPIKAMAEAFLDMPSGAFGPSQWANGDTLTFHGTLPVGKKEDS